MKRQVVKSILGLLIFSPSAYSQFDPSQVQVKEFSYDGTGCPENTIAYDISEDAQAMTILFDDFSVETSGETNVRRERDRKSCKLKLKLQTPPGWQFTLYSLNFTGYASLDEGANGFQNAVYKFDHGTPIKLGRSKLKGPYDDDYERVDSLPLNTLPWSKCTQGNHRLVVNASVAIRARNGAVGYMTIDSIDSEIVQSYGLVWRKCGGSGNQDRDKKWSAQCTAKIQKVPNGPILREVVAQAKAKNQRKAIGKARNKVFKKCKRAAQNFSRGRRGLAQSGRNNQNQIAEMIRNGRGNRGRGQARRPGGGRRGNGRARLKCLPETISCSSSQL